MIYHFSRHFPHRSITVVVLTLVFTVGIPASLPGADRIDVKLFVDEEEPYLPQRWQQRLRKRLFASFNDHGILYQPAIPNLWVWCLAVR